MVVLVLVLRMPGLGMLRSSATVPCLSRWAAGWRDSPPSAHFFDWLYAHHSEAGSNKDSRGNHQSEPRPRRRRLVSLEESQCRVVLPSVPQHMKVARQVIEKKCNSMWFSCGSRTVDSARPQREAADHGQLRFAVQCVQLD